MRVKEKRRLAGCARRLGFDRNPLRRPADRIEAAIRLVVVILLVVGVPAAAIIAGRVTDRVAVRHGQAVRATEHVVSAVLLAPAAATGAPDPYTSVQLTFAPARWQPPGRRARSGQILVPAGTPKGSVVPTWINASGSVVPPPPAHRDVVGDVYIAVITTCLISLLLLLALQTITRCALDRWRLGTWDAEWRSAGPLWNTRRG